jgi:ADP-heptose:LPS heptosyltransferase
MKVLVLQTMGMGDVVRALSPAASLQRLRPDARIDWVVEPQWAELTGAFGRSWPYIRRFGPDERWPCFRHRAWMALRLRRQRYDWAIDLVGSFRTSIMMRLAGAWRTACLTGPDARYVRRYARLLPPHPGTLRREMTHAFRLIDPRVEEERPRLPALPEPLHSGHDATIHLGAGFEPKPYPAALWAETAEILLARGLKLLVVGGEGDPELPGIPSAVGAGGPLQTAALIQESRVHLSADTGTAHLAAALRVPQVALFGPTDPGRHGPDSPLAWILKAGKETRLIRPAEAAEAALNAASGSLPGRGEQSAEEEAGGCGIGAVAPQGQVPRPGPSA